MKKMLGITKEHAKFVEDLFSKMHLSSTLTAYGLAASQLNLMGFDFSFFAPEGVLDLDFAQEIANSDPETLLQEGAIQHALNSPPVGSLKAFGEAGGKFISWRGLIDPLGSLTDLVKWFEKERELAGGKNKADDFMKLFLVPGVSHCGGGPGPQVWGPHSRMISFVEGGKAKVDKLYVTTDSSPTYNFTPPDYGVSSEPGDIDRWACSYPKVVRRIDPLLPDPNLSNYECVDPEDDQGEDEPPQ